MNGPTDQKIKDISPKEKTSAFSSVILALILAITISVLLYFSFSSKSQKMIVKNDYPQATSKNEQVISTPQNIPHRVIFSAAKSDPQPTIPVKCNIQSDPFVTGVYKENGVIFGEFHGVIQSITYNSQKLPDSLVLESTDKKQIKTFSIVKARDEIFNMQHLRDITISNLTKGKEIYIYFDCSKINNYILEQSKIGIVL